jgi:hypothetical protein
VGVDRHCLGLRPASLWNRRASAATSSTISCKRSTRTEMA